MTLSFFSSNLPATAVAFAAAVTAAFASLRYYSDKAAKVTEFRKTWVESLRLAVAEFGGSTHTIAGRIAIRSKAANGQRSGDHKNQSAPRASLGYFRVPSTTVVSVEKELATELLTHWAALRLSYNKIVLHLNPAEHLAYIKAEVAISTFASKAAPDEKIRAEVSRFLGWCIQMAERRAALPLKKKYFQFAISGLPQYVSIPSNLFDPGLVAAQQEIDRICTDPGSSLLLAAFSTRQLLHGSYKDVVSNISAIEQGIRVVDTSAAVVIKGVWETIKKGEPTYRWTSIIALLVSFSFIVFILASLSFAPADKQDPGNRFSCVELRADSAAASPLKKEGSLIPMTMHCDPISLRH
jgi:hypothetical protein